MNGETISELIRTRLGKEFDIQKIVLFGSQASGKATAASDWDVLVIANTTLPFVRRQGLALLNLGERSFPLDLLVYTPDEAARAGAVPGSAVYWAQTEGRVMYAK